jgi:DNA repair exonuclease SbcCD ATPase subunit
MKKAAQKIVVLAVGVFIISIVGCGQPEPPGEKMSRLISVENTRLKKELELRNKEIERLKELYNKESSKQDKLIADCLQEKKNWQHKARQNLRNQVKDVFDSVIEQNAKLREENERLKAQVEKLRG